MESFDYNELSAEDKKNSAALAIAICAIADELKIKDEVYCATLMMLLCTVYKDAKCQVQVVKEVFEETLIAYQKMLEEEKSS
jgi:hypothetical protein